MFLYKTTVVQQTACWIMFASFLWFCFQVNCWSCLYVYLKEIIFCPFVQVVGGLEKGGGMSGLLLSYCSFKVLSSSYSQKPLNHQVVYWAFLWKKQTNTLYLFIKSFFKKTGCFVIHSSKLSCPGQQRKQGGEILDKASNLH